MDRTRIKMALLYIIFYLSITCIWRFYETWKFGYPTPDIFHSLIAFILSVSLVMNVFLYRVLANKRSGEE